MKPSKNKPVSFNSGWRIFTIKTAKDLTEDGEKCWGRTDFDRAIISLESFMKQETYRETLLHEVTHVVLETVGFGSDENITGTNENLTVQVSRGLLQAFNLNKELFEYLLNTEEGDL